MLVTIDERVKKSVAGGKSLEQTKAERPAQEWEDRFTKSFVTSDHPIEEGYEAAKALAR